MNTRPCHHCNGSGTELDQERMGIEMRKLRESRHLSLHKVADRMKFTPAYLSDLERGKRNWNQDLIQRFKKAVGV